MIVEDVTFNYSNVKDEMGYSDVEILKGEHQIEEEGDYTVHNKERYLEKFLVYSNVKTGNYLFYMLDKKNWGPLTVDSILNPTPTDLIVLGSTTKPQKMNPDSTLIPPPARQGQYPCISLYLVF